MDENGPKMVKNGQKWQKMDENGQNGRKWQKMGQKMGNNGQKWEGKGRKLTKMAKNGRK